MSAPMSVFLRTSTHVDEFALKLQRLFGVSLRRIEDRGLIRYEHHGVGYLMTLFTDHGLEDDMGISFSRYNHQIDFSSPASGIPSEYREQLKRTVAFYAYELIVAHLGCPAMVVYNLQEKLAAHGQ